MKKVVDIKRCARCGDNHDGLEMWVLSTPIDCECVMYYTHHAVCPRTEYPILIRIVTAELGDGSLGKVEKNHDGAITAVRTSLRKRDVNVEVQDST